MLRECKNYHGAYCAPGDVCDKYCPLDIEKPQLAWANFCKMVFYGRSGWPHNSEWIVPGTITDEERV